MNHNCQNNSNDNSNNLSKNSQLEANIQQILNLNQNLSLQPLQRFQLFAEFQNRWQQNFNNQPNNDNLPEPKFLEFNSTQNSRFEKYMKKRENQIQNLELNTNEPYIKITVTKRIKSSNYLKEYYINQYGLIGSAKNTISEEILIGREFQSDIIPNDISLPDRIISRIHCKIISKNYFSKNQRIKFLYKYAIENLHNYKKFTLPPNVLERIYQFLEFPRPVYIQDLASLCGTYLKISKNQPTLIKYNQVYRLGLDTQFTITFCQPQQQNGLEIDSQFFQLLKKLNAIKEFHDIHFSDEAFQKYYDNLSLQEKDQEQVLRYQEIFLKLNEYKIPLLGIQLNIYGSNANQSYHLFVGVQIQDSQIFKLGRGQDNQLKINSNTTSRNQSRLQYIQKLKSWVIFDGESDKESENGTWNSLSSQQQSYCKQESDLIKLRNNSEIKIHEYILKVELFQGRELQLNQLNADLNKQW